MGNVLIFFFFLVGEGATEGEEFLATLGGDFGVGHFQVGELVDDDLGHDEAGVFLVIGGDDVPGGLFGGGGADAFLVGFAVVAPEVSFLGVGGAEFPVFLGDVDAGEEAFALFFLGDVEEEFDDAGAVADEVFFHFDDGAVAVIPEGGVVEAFLGEFFFLEDLGVDAEDEDFLVVGAVEDADASAFGEAAVGAPEEVVLEVFGGGLLEAEDFAALGVDAGEDVFDGAVLACGVHGLEDQEEGVAVVGVEEVLEFVEFVDVAGEMFLVVLFAGVVGVDGGGPFFKFYVVCFFNAEVFDIDFHEMAGLGLFLGFLRTWAICRGNSRVSMGLGM